MSEPPRLAVVRQGDRPRVNERLSSLLAEAFADHTVDDIDVLGAVRRDLLAGVRAAGSGVVRHVVTGGLNRRSFKRDMITSPGFAASAARVVRARVTPATHRFVVQSQGLFSAVVPGVPHFVYTDHAHLANLGYPGFDVADLATRDFLRREFELYSSTRTIFTRSEHVRNTIIHGYGQDPDRVVNVGVGPNTDPPSDHGRRVWHGGRILFVGVDWERKGGVDMIEAFRILRELHPEARLHIVGCTPECEGDEGVVVHGRVPLSRVAELMASADVFCLPTRAEPFGVAFVEAMHAGLPVVGTDIGAVPEMARPGETGDLVRVGDVAGLAAVLTSLLDDPERTLRLGDGARALARGRYDWGVVMPTIHAHIEATLESIALGASS